MLAQLHTCSLLGIEAIPVDVEVDVSPATSPKTILVGLPEAAVKEEHAPSRAGDGQLGLSTSVRPSRYQLGTGRTPETGRFLRPPHHGQLPRITQVIRKGSGMPYCTIKVRSGTGASPRSAEAKLIPSNLAWAVGATPLSSSSVGNRS